MTKTKRVCSLFYGRHSIPDAIVCYCIVEEGRGKSLHNASLLDCKTTSRMIDPAPGACIKPNFISLALVMAGPALQCSIVRAFHFVFV